MTPSTTKALTKSRPVIAPYTRPAWRVLSDHLVQMWTGFVSLYSEKK